MSGYAVVVVTAAVGALIMAQALQKTKAKMQTSPYSRENAKYKRQKADSELTTKLNYPWERVTLLSCEVFLQGHS